MKAIAVIPGTTTLRWIQRPEPAITAPQEVKMSVVRVGICGTDREEAAGGRALAPAGYDDLVVGHEMLGKVIAAGEAVTRVKPGDYAVFTVRRGCRKCAPCRMNRSDMCRTGEYHERGIWGLDGYQTERVVDHEQYIVHVPNELEALGVLCEPLSVAEKAIDEAMALQRARLPDAAQSPHWLHGRRCLVAGLGPIGLLGALALRLRGAEVYGLDIVEETSVRAQWLTGIGGRYVDGRKIPASGIDDAFGQMDLIFEATGVPKLVFNLLDALAPSGLYVLTGIPGGTRPLEVPGAQLLRGLVLSNQVMVGSVNASRDHFQMEVEDLSHAQLRWGKHIDALITQRHPAADFEAALEHHGADEIKVVLEWAH
jgi:threonine dehydrogenase-like Zn-dependent dehydrogenase